MHLGRKSVIFHRALSGGTTHNTGVVKGILTFHKMEMVFPFYGFQTYTITP
jgi:hypothetical protein